ncbi:MAG TPA: EamA/RhaT family transporter, partial [Pseudolysinimonas sp.]
MVAILGFVSAVVYGASDFLGGLASRRMSALLASFIGFLVATVVTVVALLIERPVWSTEAVVLGALAGVAGSIGTWALYA